MKKLRLSSTLNLHGASKENISEYVKQGLIFYKEIGFDAVDFPTYLFDLSSDDCLVHAEQALRDSEEIGIKFELSHLLFSGRVCKEPDYLPIFNERMHRSIDIAATLGVDHAVFHPNTTTIPMKNYSRKAEYDSVMNHLSPFVEHANKVGLNVVIENMRYVPHFAPVHRYCQTPDELCEVADALGIGVCWDFGHAHINGIKQSEGLQYVGKRLKMLHVNDNFATEDEHLLPFLGNIDWKDAMHGLALVGFDGLFNYEVAASRVPDAVKEAYAKYIIESANELMSYIV